jgi:hypothetical protein
LEGTKSVDLLPSEYSVNTRIHEYGGAAATVCLDGSLIFTDAKLSGVYKLSPSGSVEEIIKGDGENKLRFGDFHVNPAGPKWILAVQEEHGKEVLNTIVSMLRRRRSTLLLQDMISTATADSAMTGSTFV